MKSRTGYKVNTYRLLYENGKGFQELFMKLLSTHTELSSTTERKTEPRPDRPEQPGTWGSDTKPTDHAGTNVRGKPGTINSAGSGSR